MVPFLHNFLKKLVSNVFSIWGGGGRGGGGILSDMNLPKEGTNQLPRAGFD